MLYSYFYNITVISIAKYPFFRVIMALLTSFAIMLFLTPLFIRRLIKINFNQIIRSCIPQKNISKSKTPIMGGLLILISFTVSTILWANLYHAGILIILFIIFGFGIVGFYDDYIKIKKKNTIGLSIKKKFYGLQ
jgi:phospho-N-acetylmuramoyl-pentapeptide-transferase